MPGHDVLGQCAAHPRHGALARRSPDAQLGDERIVEARDRAARVGAAVVAHARTGGDDERVDDARRRQETRRRVLRVDAALDGRAARRQVALREAQRLALRDADHLAHQIEPRHQLRHRVLDLQARVHLEEVEVPVFGEQELERPGAEVADALRALDGDRAHARDELARRRRDWASLRRPSGCGAGSSSRARTRARGCPRDRRGPGSRRAAGE